MKAFATVTGPTGKVKLTFGIYGLKNFCKRLGCEPAIYAVLQAFQGGTRLEAMAEIIRSGMEQRGVDAGEPVTVTDYDACAILETASEQEADAAMKAFLSSIVGEDYDEWFNRLQSDYEKATAAKDEETDQVEAEKKSEPGTTSKAKPTEK